MQLSYKEVQFTVQLERLAYNYKYSKSYIWFLYCQFFLFSILRFAFRLQLYIPTNIESCDYIKLYYNLSAFLGYFQITFIYMCVLNI